MLTYLFAVLAAVVNAVSSVLQRKAHRDEPVVGSLSWRLLLVLHKPVWLLGFLAVVAGFLLQATALSFGALSVVEPILVIELPLTLLIASLAFEQRLHARDWTAALAMTAGVSVLLYALSPMVNGAPTVSTLSWSIGLPVNVVWIAVLVAGSRGSSPGRAAALLGVATGSAFGLTVALVKGMTTALDQGGVPRALATWQTYALVVTGVLGVFLLQGALNAGALTMAQPGITIADPVVSMLWGIFGYGEMVRTGGYLLVALGGVVMVAAGVYGLARSTLISETLAPSAASQHAPAVQAVDGGDTEDRRAGRAGSR